MLALFLFRRLGRPYTEIHSIQDEINFWNEKTISSPTKSDKIKARDFVSTIGQLNEQIRSIDSNSIKSIEEYLNLAHNTLDELWRLSHNYPQNRMADLMDIIGNYSPFITVYIILILYKILLKF